MSKVKGSKLSFPTSASPDVVGYKLYMAEDPHQVDYDSPSWDLGSGNESMEVDLSTLPGMTSKDGVFNLGVVAIDDAGNESSMSQLNGVAIDFVAPDPPGPVVLSPL